MMEQDAMSVCKAKWRDLHGLPLLPLEDGSLGTISGGSAIYILANKEQQSLLPHLRNRFLSLQMLKRLAAHVNSPEFLSAMGIADFSPAVLAQNIEPIIPGSWKGKGIHSCKELYAQCWVGC